MAEADLSKIVSLIMENPKLIEEIRGLAEEKSEANAEPEASETAANEKEEIAVPAYAPPPPSAKAKRRELLSALKPYVSEERCKAIDSMMSISEIWDMMKTR